MRHATSRAALLISLFALVAPVSLRAQQRQQAEPPSPPSTSLVVEGSFRLSRLRGGTAHMGGAAVLLTVDRRLSFGLAGWTLFSDLSVQRPGGALDFAFAYGGAVGDFRIMDGEATFVSARLLVGAGNGKLSLPAVGTEIEADNFGVVEPEICTSLRVAGPLRFTVAAGYRTVFGVQDLPGVATRDLRGWTSRGSLSLQLF